MLLDAFESLCHIYLHCNNLCLIELHHVVKLEPSRIFYNDLLQIVLNQPICSMHATANEEAWILAGEPVCQWLTGAKTWDATASKNNRNLSKLTLIHFQWKHLLLQSIRIEKRKNNPSISNVLITLPKKVIVNHLLFFHSCHRRFNELFDCFL